MPSYVLGDIHGHYDLMRRAQDLVEIDRAREGYHDAPLVHLGDLVDRGPASAQVIDHLMQAQTRGENWIVLKGNHDRLFQMFLRDPWERDPNLRAERPWLHPNVGGSTTLRSYGLRSTQERPLAQVHAEALTKIPDAHRDWIAALPSAFGHEEAFFVHAGIRPGVPFEAQTEDDKLWIRAAFHDDPRDHGALVVHGHTAIDAATHYGNRLNMDSSAAYGGPVSAAVIEGRSAWLLTAKGRFKLG